jgi:hypothetical protein
MTINIFSYINLNLGILRKSFVNFVLDINIIWILLALLKL